jgi:hypothetical protein
MIIINTIITMMMMIIIIIITMMMMMINIINIIIIIIIITVITIITIIIISFIIFIKEFCSLSICILTSVELPLGKFHHCIPPRIYLSKVILLRPSTRCFWKSRCPKAMAFSLTMSSLDNLKVHHLRKLF